MLAKATEEITTLRGESLRLSFDPAAIRRHFGDRSQGARRLAALSDEVLAEVGLAALESDTVDTAFNHALRDACEQLAGFDPEGDPDVEFLPP